MKVSSHIAVVVLLTVIISSGYYVFENTKETREKLAGVFFTQSVTVTGLESKYKSGQKIKVLIVPGHEPNYGGALYKDLQERDMALALGLELARYFKNNGHYDVVMTRDENGWNPSLEHYFDTQWHEIQKYVKNQKAEMARLIAAGKIERAVNGPAHGSAPGPVATRLFGINKWANETGVDIMLHLHFNDIARKNPNKPGDYTGFTIYVPDYQYSNAAATRVMASDVFRRLSSVARVSTLPKEDQGIVDDQELIAIGQSNTADAVSMLIEYGYIYEPQFADESSRRRLFPTLAEQTYFGVEDFFNGSNQFTKR